MLWTEAVTVTVRGADDKPSSKDDSAHHDLPCWAAERDGDHQTATDNIECLVGRGKKKEKKKAPAFNTKFLLHLCLQTFLLNRNKHIPSPKTVKNEPQPTSIHRSTSGAGSKSLMSVIRYINRF